MKTIILAISLLTFVANSAVLAQSEEFSREITSRISERTVDGSFAQSNGNSFNPRMSKNGRFVVFESTATNLVTDPVSNIDWDSTTNPVSGRRRIYLYDRQANSVELVSLSSPTSNSPFTDIKADCFNPVVSNDGRYVAFTVAYSGAAPIRDIVNQCLDPACHVNIPHEGQHIYVRDRVANDTMLFHKLLQKFVDSKSRMAFHRLPMMSPAARFL
jgi:Tol biopolymer transport system component